MGISAGHEGERRDLDLRSQSGSFRNANRPEAMPERHYEEFRDSVDGMTIELKRGESLHINPKVTASNLVRVLFATDVEEGVGSHSVRLKIIVADEVRPGVTYRIDPTEVCLIQKFGGIGEHDVRIDPKWDPKLGILEFENLRFGSRYVLAFTTAGSGDLAEVEMPPVPRRITSEVK